MTLPFLYQLQNVSFSELNNLDFKVSVIDMDDANLSLTNMDQLHAQGKTMYTYLSIGEAEDYRDYWASGNLHANSGFVLGQNPDWPGNYSVKFWDPAWQNIMFSRVADAVHAGYDGMYLDIVDAYEVGMVKNAYTGPGTVRDAMLSFVENLSAYGKSLDPDFKVIPQNAVGLLALNENNPDIANLVYLNAIDGLGVEDLWYDGNNISDWTNDDLQFIQNAIEAGKFVLATSYPTTDDKQADFINHALSQGLIPFVADRDLTGVIDSLDNGIFDHLPSTTHVPWGVTPSEPPVVPPVEPPVIPPTEPPVVPPVEPPVVPPTEPPVVPPTTPPTEPPVTPPVVPPVEEITLGTRHSDRLIGDDANDTLLGRGGNDRLVGNSGDDILTGGSGKDTLTGGSGHDIFVFLKTSETVGSSRDVITDFTQGEDKIDLSRIDANVHSGGNQAFSLIEGKFTHAAQLREVYSTVHGVQHTIIEGNTDRDFSAEFKIDLIGHYNLTAQDFVL